MTLTTPDAVPGFTVHLGNFEGPFDLLLQLISRHRLDITEVALSIVTDEFIAYVKDGQQQRGPGSWDLEQISQFIVVAATLLDLKAARLLPQGEVEDAEDLALLEARDLLFARLLQYRAFKEVSRWIATTLETEGRRFARPGGLEGQFKALLPELTFTATPDQLAWLAARAFTPAEAEQVSLSHLHQAKVSVREQAEIVVAALRERGSASFRDLTADAGERLVVVARFLALLELFRERAVSFEQLTPLGELRVRWVAGDADAVQISAEFDTEDTQEGADD
ncbi:MAG: ScpA family protein [Micropruina sp.]